ncbi:FAD-linked sulfhydryl oxidase ALR [Condylostylus longicornis]|uniref:FAD-linked sulfhydryl oxidase ALR n=1 Tax=Condylostylus longicornis TaxID=2530218 RepID=UPI00244DE2BD|nr:FAD-linked sulfhydryl oxidase ALR [Condylostylus longicornis]
MDSISKKRNDISIIGCRSCEDFKTWSKEQSQVYSNRKTQPRIDCPMDKGELGRATWGLLHTISVSFPKNPSDDEKKDAINFISCLSRLYPCEYCAKDFQEDLKENPVDVTSRDKFSSWMCNFHNRVNKKLGKPLFDCSKVYQRWKDGWSDGSCDE